MNDHTEIPTPAAIRSAVATVGTRVAERFGEVPEDAITPNATDSQRAAVTLLRVLLTGADSLTSALASGDDDAVDRAISAVAGDPLLGDLTANRPGAPG